MHSQANWDILILPLEDDEVAGLKPGKPSIFLSTPFVEAGAAFSPDGRWLAYYSNESGAFEVYVRPFPGPGGKWQVSAGGGMPSVWSRNGTELFYWWGEQIWKASWSVSGESFRPEKPRAWSPRPVPRWPGFQARFDLHSDGRRFAILKAADEETEFRRDKVVFITNFFDELRRIAPPPSR
jgi:serine/threonine-protein kinase